MTTAIIITIALAVIVIALFLAWRSGDLSTPTCDDIGCTCTGRPGDETHL